jgi:hypothetical protein
LARGSAWIGSIKLDIGAMAYQQFFEPDGAQRIVAMPFPEGAARKPAASNPPSLAAGFD